MKRARFYLVRNFPLKSNSTIFMGSVLRRLIVFAMEVERSLSQIYNSYVISRPNTCVDGDGTVPAESAKADGLKAEARVGVPGEHRGILCERHVFRILKHWLKAGDPDPYYNPLNDYVILPTAFEMEQHKENDQVASLKGEWEIISHDQDECSHTISLSAISVSHGGPNQSCSNALAGVLVHSGNNCEQHVQLNELTVSVDA